MASVVVDLRFQIGKLYETLKALDGRATEENRDLSAEERTNWETAVGQIASLRERIRRQEYLDSVPAQDEERRVFELHQDERAGPPESEEEAKARGKRAYEEGFRDYISASTTRIVRPESWEVLHRGQTPLTDQEVQILRRLLPERELRQMGVSNLTGGGFWVPDEMMQRVEKAQLWFGGMRQVAEVITTDTGGDLPWPVYDDTANVGRRLAENAAVTQTNVAVGLRVLKAYMYSSDLILMSLQLLQDRPDIAEGIIADALGERIGRVTNTEFTTYAGGDGPQGLIRATTVGVTAAAAAAVTADELHQLKYAVNRSYRERPGVAYMAADATLAAALRLKDAEGRYIFTNPNSGDEPRIWGTPVVVNNDMPALATGNITWEFGWFGAYKIRDVKGFTLLRLEERYADNLQVGFIGFSRHDGGYVNAGQNPIQHVVQA